MDRLKGKISYYKKLMLFYLHSSMDRLKEELTLEPMNTSIYLHSSMDRLKVKSLHEYSKYVLIYIPVWID